MANMKLSREGAMEMIGHEGICLEPYEDTVGVLTIGMGHTKAAGLPDPAKVTKALTVKECFELFREDVEKYVKTVNAAVTGTVSQNQFDALVSFHFNTGGIKKATLVKSLNAVNKTKAAKEFLNWKKPPEVLGRRKKEQKLFAEGKYSHGGKATIWPVENKAPQFNKGKLIDLATEI